MKREEKENAVRGISLQESGHRELLALLIALEDGQRDILRRLGELEEVHYLPHLSQRE